jgi:hypothetical protein
MYKPKPIISLKYLEKLVEESEKKDKETKLNTAIPITTNNDINI